MDEEEKQEIKELINLLYNNHISQYGKRKLENYIKELQKEIKELKDDKEGLINGYKDTAYKLEELRVNYNKLEKELEKNNKRIDMCIDLLNGEGCLNFDTKQEKLDYIDKLIKLEVEDEKK